MKAPNGFFPYSRAGLVYPPLFGEAPVVTPPAWPITNLFGALVETVVAYGPWHKMAGDGLKTDVSLGQILARTLTLSRVLHRVRRDAPGPMALMLPNGLATLYAFFALQQSGDAVTMLNFSAGAAALLNACETAQVESILTSHRFIEAADLGAVASALVSAGLQLFYLEDLAAQSTWADRLWGMAHGFAPRRARPLAPATSQTDPAVILFTSGSEGTPKGVVLSHRNLLANIAQFTAQVDLTPDDIMFACLPLYHSFGLTVGMLLPLLSGMKIIFYPSPLHYHLVPERLRQTQATILLSTDTFMTGYARKGEAADFASLRYIVPGAEKLKDTTREIWENRYGKTLIEGYGATETAPVVSVNVPQRRRPGTVGPLLPGIEAHLEPVPGLKEGGSLCVRGPNIMLGIMKHEAPGIIQPPPGGWYNTGDIATIDAEGYVTIKGRLKRFAKIGGEMVSLTAIEQAAARVWPEKCHAVLNIPHARKGEALILVTEQEGVDRTKLLEDLRAQGLPDIAIPHQIVWLEKIPVLGAGKIDYTRTRALAVPDDNVGRVAAAL
jgi:acyl-[acyl-carrier-protein]-phospholipid O-acyltransferase/long-chain-fatty-acid--[acyl-carrier-protein] ligase